MTKKSEDRPNNLNRSERPQRTPIHGLRDKLSVDGQEAGFHYVWVNDYNVDSYLSGGYDFVTHNVKVGDKHINVAASGGGKVSFPVGNGVTGFLMRITDEFYKEDQQTVQKEIDEKEQALQADLNSKSDGRYGKVELSQSKPLRG